MRQNARNAAIGKCINRIELSLGRELVKCHVEGDVKGLALALLGRAARSHNEGAEGELVERPAAGTGLAASKDQAVPRQKANAGQQREEGQGNPNPKIVPPEIPGEHQPPHRGQIGPHNQQPDVQNHTQQDRQAGPSHQLIDQAEEKTQHRQGDQSRRQHNVDRGLAGDIQQIAFREKVGGDKAENGDDQDEDRQNADGLHQVAHQHFFRRSGFRDRRGGLFRYAHSCPALR